MTKWPEIGSEAFSTPLDAPIFKEPTSPEIENKDIRESGDIFFFKRGSIDFSHDTNMVDGRNEDIVERKIISNQ